MNKFFTLIILLHVGIAYAQRPLEKDTSQIKKLDDISLSLDEYVRHNPKETPHVHFDKGLYNVNDTVWYKIYVTNGFSNKLSALSKIVHIEIVDSSSIIQKNILPLNAGMAEGYLALSTPKFKPGTYQFNVFTRLMGNEKRKFYSFNLKVGTEIGSGMTVIGKEVAALHFYPEGGTFIADLRSKIVVESLDSYGNPVETNGYIKDGKNNKVAEFNTGRSGMGMFALSPKPQGIYEAVLEEKPNDKKFALPKVIDSGYVLAVNSFVQDTVNIKISKSLGSNVDVRLVLQANGSILNSIPIALLSGSSVLKVPTASLSEGLYEVALFSIENKLLANRFFFIPLKNSSGNILILSQDEYRSREQVKINLNITDASGAGVVGGYSISVAKVDEVLDKHDGRPTIWSSLIFDTDVTRNHNRYSSDLELQNKPGKAELDMQLLAQESNTFSWDEVFAQKQRLPGLKPEQSLFISGKVLKTDGKPMAGAKLNLFSARDMILIDTVADDQGRFLFENFTILDSADIVIRVKNIGNEKNVQIILDDTMGNFMNSMPDTIISEVTAFDKGGKPIKNTSNAQSSAKEKVNELKTVEVSAKRRIVIPGSAYPFAAAPPDYTIEAEELHKIMNLTDYLRSRFIGVTVLNNKVVSPGGGKLIILLNGMNIEDLSYVDPRSLTGVEIVRGGIIALNMANTVPQPHGSEPGEPNMYGQHISNGIIFLTSNHHNPKLTKSVEQTTGIIRTQIVGLSVFKDFYSPNYALKPVNAGKDLRNPLFWNPNIITRQDGSSEIDFYTADEKGKFQVTLEGVGINGQITREIAFFMVK